MQSQQSSSSSDGHGAMISSQQSSSSSGGNGNMVQSQQSSVSSGSENLQMNQQSAMAHNADGSTDMGAQQQLSSGHTQMQQQSGMEIPGKGKRSASESPSGFLSALAARALARE